ncbi:MAG TPA: 4Fe-4S binding protein [Coriobacteriia bacterium]
MTTTNAASPKTTVNVQTMYRGLRTGSLNPAREIFAIPIAPSSPPVEDTEPLTAGMKKAPLPPMPTVCERPSVRKRASSPARWLLRADSPYGGGFLHGTSPPGSAQLQDGLDLDGCGMEFAYPHGVCCCETFPIRKTENEVTMFKASIDPNRCDRAPGCPASRVCRSGSVIRMSPSEPWRVDSDTCTGCGMCVRVCPTGACSMSVREEN